MTQSFMNASALSVVVLAGALGVARANSEVSVEPYQRSLYEHWIDADQDCQDTRQEVLVAESLAPVELDEQGCHVRNGQWEDAFTGDVVTRPSEIDVDHRIPLAEAHRSGAAFWAPEKRARFANDLSHSDALIAVTGRVNRQKGDRDPASWLPPDPRDQCRYVEKWVLLKAAWELSMDEREKEAVRTVLRRCRLGELPATPMLSRAARPGSAAPAACKDVNTATGAEFEMVSGIGPSRAAAIVEYRAANGPFASVADLESVSGIGPATVARVRQANFCVPDATSSETGPMPSIDGSAPQSGPSGEGSSGPAPPQDCMNINTATVADFQSITGIGPSRARSIIEYRDANGPFASVQAMSAVPGIGPATVSAIARAGFCTATGGFERPSEASRSDTPSGAPGRTQAGQAARSVNCADINTASESDFRRVRGIGEAKARAIVEYREANGPFLSVQGLLKVSGIGQATLATIKQAGFCVSGRGAAGLPPADEAARVNDQSRPFPPDETDEIAEIGETVAVIERHPACSDVNSATAADLTGVIGIGARIAGSIVRYREEHGSFHRMMDLIAVPGIATEALTRLGQAGFCVPPDRSVDCRAIRQEALVRTSVVPVEMDVDRCDVLRGEWLDPYSQIAITDPGGVVLEPIVPLAEAERSGADQWTPEHRTRFVGASRDPEALMAVAAGPQRPRGRGDPANWLPQQEFLRCQYVRRWVLVKATWDLQMDGAEAARVAEILQACP